MDAGYERKRFKLEDYWWGFTAKRDIISRILRYLDIKPRSKILDVGCGGGHIIRLLKAMGLKKIYGIDISARAVRHCKEKGLKNVSRQDCTKMRFSNETFDCLIVADVLEHIENERVALVELNRILKPSGKLILIVPAFNFLRSLHDRTVGHYRRYSKSQLVSVLTKSGFKVEKISFWEFLLFFPMVMMVTFHKLFPISQKSTDYLKEVHPIINSFIKCLLRIENSIASKWGVPLGISIYAVVRKV